MLMPTNALGDEPVLVDECSTPPNCGNFPACEKKIITEVRDSRTCVKNIKFLFGRILRFHDSKCEAEKARKNAMYAKQRALLEANYRQCLEEKESAKLKCEIKYTDWEICVSKKIKSFPPQDFQDRKILYNRCYQLGGKDEFTDVCCSHYYKSDKENFGLCQQ